MPHYMFYPRQKITSHNKPNWAGRGKKIDLAGFNIKLRENLLCTLKKYLFLQKHPANPFFIS
jgi:hypothetical protein